MSYIILFKIKITVRKGNKYVGNNVYCFICLHYLRTLFFLYKLILLQPKKILQRFKFPPQNLEIFICLYCFTILLQNYPPKLPIVLFPTFFSSSYYASSSFAFKTHEKIKVISVLWCFWFLFFIFFFFEIWL